MRPEQIEDPTQFRTDLLFRLNTVEIELPPLRERAEDVPLLLEHFLQLYARKYGKPARALPSSVLAGLQGYEWPGNVRALRHAAERAVILAEGEAYTLSDFPLSRAAPAIRIAPESLHHSAPAADAGLNLGKAEKQMIERALQKHAYNISAAATELGLTRGSLYRRMEKHGL
jgi:DNA-binding NtrC family response regulator